jgi:hypothetical protein
LARRFEIDSNAPVWRCIPETSVEARRGEVLKVFAGAINLHTLKHAIVTATPALFCQVVALAILW